MGKVPRMCNRSLSRLLPWEEVLSYYAAGNKQKNSLKI